MSDTAARRTLVGALIPAMLLLASCGQGATVGTSRPALRPTQQPTGAAVGDVERDAPSGAIARQRALTPAAEPTFVAPTATAASPRLATTPTAVGAPGEHEPPVDVLVTRDDHTLPSGCRPWQVAALITTFLDAANRGDARTVSRTFRFSDRPGPGGGARGWSWYRVNLGVRAEDESVAGDSEALLAYLAARRGRGERLALVTVRVGHPSGFIGRHVDFIGHVRIRADDLGSRRGAWGLAAVKGVVDCERRELNRWMMATTAKAPRSWECPTVPGWSPGQAALACRQP